MTIVLGLLVLLVVGGAFWFAIQNKKKREAAAASWASVEGEITGSEVRRTRDTDGEGGFTYDPLVTYRYIVGGETLTGSRLNFSAARHQFPKKAEEAVARYPAGTRVTVYYDPAKPHDSVLERKTA
jgi:hypothetical protein